MVLFILREPFLYWGRGDCGMGCLCVSRRDRPDPSPNSTKPKDVSSIHDSKISQTLFDVINMENSKAS